MCGICGYTGERFDGLLQRMCARLAHRGPDAEGHIEHNGAHLANRRLAVIDLEGGDQPMWSPDGRFGLVYNGEAYNFRALRDDLSRNGWVFRSESDTEVVLALLAMEGAGALRRLNGMFALALLDTREQTVLLARDPVGIKPLLYWHRDRTLVFGSEAKAILEHPDVRAELDPDALHLLLNVRFVPGPRTLFRGIRQLMPGTCMTVHLDTGECRTETFQSLELEHRERWTAPAAAERFLELLDTAVHRQRIADVPLGLYLSGGLDSSALLAGARHGGGEVRTFTLGFNEPTDEVEDAARMAGHFGALHHAESLSPNPLALYPRVVYHAESPKVNAAQGYYLARFVRDHVTVALSGMGGDELFLGYDLYDYLWPGRLLCSGIGSALGPLSGLFDAAAGGWDTLAGPAGENPRRGIELLASAGDPLRYYTTLRNGWDLRPGAADRIYSDGWRKKLQGSTREAFAPLFDRPDLPLPEQVQMAELRGKMVDDFLWNEDRMSMANSLEVRVPLLDLEMIRFALSLPLSVKFQNGLKKAVMKRALAPILPQDATRKRKWGFTFNPHLQFTKDLRSLAARELTEDFLKEQGIVRPGFVRTILHHRPTPKMRWHYFMLWQILGLKFWQEIFLEGRDWSTIEARLAAETTR
jgi:asparagine synthase (glutamine-hydrolysing)